MINTNYEIMNLLYHYSNNANASCIGTDTIQEHNSYAKHRKRHAQLMVRGGLGIFQLNSIPLDREISNPTCKD